MSWRGWRTALVALLLLTGGGVVAAELVGHDSGRRTTGTASLTSSSDRRAGARCHGITHRQVRGLRPTYTRKKLAAFANDRVVCHAIWLPEPRRWFVPQGLAISGNGAWISGFRWKKEYGERQCQLVRVSLLTGRRAEFHTAIWGSVGKRPRGFCRHGGGIVQRGPWLWVVEKNRVWLVHTGQRSEVLRATRVWRVHSPARGSSVVVTRSRLGLVPYQTSGKPRIYWFSRSQMMRRGVLDLTPRGGGGASIAAIASTRVPRYVQGATVDVHGRLYLTRSNLSCGELVTPTGRRIAFVPGAEGIDFAAQGRRLWAVSESGAQPYSHSRKPLTAAVTSFEFPRLLRGTRTRCGFARY